MKNFFCRLVFAASLSALSWGSLWVYAETDAQTPSALTAPSVQTYEELLRALRELLAQKPQNDKEEIKQFLEIGKLINQHAQQNKERADFNPHLVRDLSEDLHLRRRQLNYMSQFAEVYAEKIPEGLSLRFYRDLMSVGDAALRDALTRQAIEEKWTHERLYQEILNIHAAEKRKRKLENEIALQPGPLHTYRVVKNSQGQLVLELGFYHFFQLKGWELFQEGDIVRAPHEEDSSTGKPPEALISKWEKVSLPASSLYTYAALVTHVKDGDTFQAEVDFGLGFITLENFRLRGLDAPEMDTPEGVKAKSFLVNEIAKTKGRVILKAVNPDKYGRFLAQVWIDGKDLNQMLIEKGYAQKVSPSDSLLRPVENRY